MDKTFPFCAVLWLASAFPLPPPPDYGVLSSRNHSIATSVVVEQRAVVSRVSSCDNVEHCHQPSQKSDLLTLLSFSLFSVVFPRPDPISPTLKVSPAHRNNDAEDFGWVLLITGMKTNTKAASTLAATWCEQTEARGFFNIVTYRCDHTAGKQGLAGSATCSG